MLFIKFVLTKNIFYPLSAKLIKWPNTLKQFVGNLPTNCLSVFGHFVGVALKGLIIVLKKCLDLHFHPRGAN